MKPETAKQLEEILDGRKKQNQDAWDRAIKQDRAEAKNLADFSAKKQQIIKPALREIVDLYKRRGIDISIEEQEEHPNERGGTNLATIRLNMAERNDTSSPMKPEFTLAFEKRKRSLSLFTSTKSSSGPAGSVALDDITADWIHDAFLKYERGQRP